MSQLVFSSHWNPKEVGSDDGEEMDLPVKASKVRQSQEKEASFFHVLYRGCQKEVWPRLSVDLPT